MHSANWPHARLARFLRQRTHDMGLLPRLLVAEVLVFAMVFAGGLYLITTLTGSLQKRIMAERLLLGEATAESLDAALEDGMGSLRQLGELYLAAVESGDWVGFRAALDFVLEGPQRVFTGGILVLDGDFAVKVGSHVNPGVEDVDMRGRLRDVWMATKGASGIAAIPLQAAGRHGPWVAIVAPLGADGRDGFVVGAMGLLDSYPADLIARAVALGGSGHGDVVDRRGVALLSTRPYHVLITGDHPVDYATLFAQHEAKVMEMSNDVEAGPGVIEPHLMAFVPLDTLPWAVAMGTTVSEAYAPARNFLYGSIGFLMALTGLAFAATVFACRRIVQPMKALSAAATSVAEGDRETRVETPWGGEIGEMARSLETMRRRLHAWGAELEEQVAERTSELASRNRELRTLYETLQRKEEQLRALLGRVLGAQEEERRRVSRELHDGVGQALSALALGLEALEQARPWQWDELQARIDELRELATQSLGDLRRLAVALRPAALDDLGLVPAIRRYAELYLGNAGIPFTLVEDGVDSRVSPAIHTVVYRVVQEAINNVARHSGATRVGIELRFRNGALAATVDDNGRGFDVDAPVSAQGIGLEGMKERASLVGGTLAVGSRPGHGTQVRLEIPLSERASA